ncbi:MAG: hypothetical protein FWE67_09770 [Planctomycetaceae bacterium]|nr:hypothetical protein [Planctomycetaceae bacterium]
MFYHYYVLFVFNPLTFIPSMLNNPKGSYISQIDVFSATPQPAPEKEGTISDLCSLMREMITGQERQTKVMEDLLAQINHKTHRRTFELALWKKAHPILAENCRSAASKLERIQTDLLSVVTEEVEYSESLLDSEFALSEFIDRFGAKFMHLNAMLQMLSMLGNAPEIQIHSQEKSTEDGRLG